MDYLYENGEKLFDMIPYYTSALQAIWSAACMNTSIVLWRDSPKNIMCINWYILNAPAMYTAPFPEKNSSRNGAGQRKTN